MQRILILGAGGHAQVVADILMHARGAGKEVEPLGYLDDDPGLAGKNFLGLSVVGVVSDLSRIKHDAVVVAIGNNSARSKVYARLIEQGERFAVALHPSANIAPGVKLGQGTMVCAGVVVNPQSEVGEDVILNTGCTLDHHNKVGAHAHIAPGVHTGGEVVIGEGAFVGIGAVVLPQVKIGAWSVVGAGAVVLKDVPPGVTVVGVPARPAEKKG
jgi:sugar O-acyltransferase (sialic acid O-acetyltransferase NeuD family)